MRAERRRGYVRRRTSRRGKVHSRRGVRKARSRAYPAADETQAAELILGGFIASVPDLKTARLVAETAEKFGRRFKIHLKVNTGMNRYGMNASLLGKVCLFLKAHPQIEVEGLYSHLYTHSREESERQRLLFLRMKGVCERYYPSVLCHLSATYGALLGEAFSFDMVRVGLGLYGYLPEGIDPALRERISLRPAMAVYAQAVQSRKYSFGGAGYRGTLRRGESAPFLSHRLAGRLCGRLRMEKGQRHERRGKEPFQSLHGRVRPQRAAHSRLFYAGHDGRGGNGGKIGHHLL